MNLKDGNGFAPSARRIVLLLLLAGLAALGYAVLHLFLVPVAWAVIVAYVTWPTYRRLRAMLRGSAVASALLMTVLLTHRADDARTDGPLSGRRQLPREQPSSIA
jgi:predicted PurR-regulated permease PerM